MGEVVSYLVISAPGALRLQFPKLEPQEEPLSKAREGPVANSIITVSRESWHFYKLRAGV